VAAKARGDEGAFVGFESVADMQREFDCVSDGFMRVARGPARRRVLAQFLERKVCV
jgi:hypothetical protein